MLTSIVGIVVFCALCIATYIGSNSPGVSVSEPNSTETRSSDATTPEPPPTLQDLKSGVEAYVMNMVENDEDFQNDHITISEIHTRHDQSGCDYIAQVETSDGNNENLWILTHRKGASVTDWFLFRGTQ